MEKYSFFNSVNGDRKAFAEDWARHLKRFFTNGVFNNGLQVKVNGGMSIAVSLGSAFIEGYRYDIVESEEIRTCQNADGNQSRIDSLVVRKDLTNRQITSEIIQGNYATSPIPPVLTRNANIWEIRLSNIYINQGITEITQDLIEDTRFNSDDCGNVICAVQNIDTTDIFNQYDAKFMELFQQMRDLLDGDTAGQLQNQINKITSDMVSIKEIDSNQYLTKDEIIVDPTIPKYEKLNSLITLGNANDVPFANSYLPFSFSEATITGELLTLSDDGGVKIGQGVKKVKVSGATSLASAGNAELRRLAICRNNTVRARTQNQLAGYQSFSISPKSIDVKEDDVITLKINGTSTTNSGTASGGNETTYLTVEVVEVEE